MGQYVDHKAVVDAKIATTQFQYEALGGDDSTTRTFYFYSDGDNPTTNNFWSMSAKTASDTDYTSLVTNFTSSAVSSLKDALVEWKNANASVTEGVMFDHHANLDDTVDAAAERLAMKTHLAELTADATHLQHIIDNGEDASSVVCDCAAL